MNQCSIVYERLFTKYALIWLSLSVCNYMFYENNESMKDYPQSVLVSNSYSPEPHDVHENIIFSKCPLFLL